MAPAAGMALADGVAAARAHASIAAAELGTQAAATNAAAAASFFGALLHILGIVVFGGIVAYLGID